MGNRLFTLFRCFPFDRVSGPRSLPLGPRSRRSSTRGILCKDGSAYPITGTSVMTGLLHYPSLLFSVATVHGDWNLLSASWLRNSDIAHPGTGRHHDEESFHHIWGRCTVRLPPIHVVEFLSWGFSLPIRPNTYCLDAIKVYPYERVNAIQLFQRIVRP